MDPALADSEGHRRRGTAGFWRECALGNHGGIKLRPSRKGSGGLHERSDRPSDIRGWGSWRGDLSLFVVRLRKSSRVP